MSRVFSQTAFADLIQVSMPTLSGYLRDGKLRGDAIYGTGRRRMINVDIALEQLLDLDIGQSGYTAKGAKRAAAVLAAIEGERAYAKSTATKVEATENAREQKRRLLKLRADTAEAKLAQARRKFISRAEANEAVAQTIRLMTAKLLAVPDRLPAEFCSADRDVLRGLIDRRLHDVKLPAF